MSTPYVADKADFDRLANADLPVLVDFTATWCGPCQALAPIIDEIRPELQGRCEVVKLDIDAVPEIAEKYNVMGVPTLALFEDGEQLVRWEGGANKQELLGRLEPFLDAAPACDEK